MGAHAPKQWPERATVEEFTDKPATEISDPAEDIPTPPIGDVEATDAARDLAAERGIDLGDVTGTGTGGRITKDDVQSFADQPD